MPGTVRVFHCDDSSAFRILVREMLQDYGAVEIVGEAAGLEEAVDKLREAQADVVLVDLFEEQHEDEILGSLRAVAPGAGLVLYTGMPETHAPSGFERHVHKSAPFDELHRTILEVAAQA